MKPAPKSLYCLCLGFLPLLLGHEAIYWWTTQEGLADKVIHDKNLYLNIPFLWIRWVVYSLFLLRSGLSRSQVVEAGAETKSTDFSAKLEKLSAPGIPFFFILMTFCAVDYLMVLEPHWYSTVYGFMIVIGWCLTAMAVVVATLGTLVRFAPFDHALRRSICTILASCCWRSRCCGRICSSRSC